MNVIKTECEESNNSFQDSEFSNDIQPSTSTSTRCQESVGMILEENDEEGDSLNTPEFVNIESVAPNVPENHLGLRILDGTFFKYIPSESNASIVTASCVKCSSKIRGKIDYCTANFLNHLRRKHGQASVNEYQKFIKYSKTKTVANLRKPRKLQGAFNENILKYFINSMIPMKTMEDPFFLKIFSGLEVSKMGLELINLRSLSQYVENYYGKQKALTKLELRDVDYVCTAINICTNGKRRFLCVSAHWITNDLTRKSVGLACQEISTLNYGEISEEMQKINAEFNLDGNKIVATIIVSSHDFSNALQKLGVELSNINGVKSTEESMNIEDELISECGPEPENEENQLRFSANDQDILNSHESQHCCAHMLTHCVTTDVIGVLTEKEHALSKAHFNAMAKCNEVWKVEGYRKNTEFKIDTLKSKHSKPCATRWNSLYDALQQMLDMDEVHLKHQTYAFQNIDINYLKEFLTCASPIREALDILQNETNAYYGIVLPCLHMLRKKMQKVEEDCVLLCRPLIKSYIQSVEARFEKLFNTNTPESENAAIAALSYPRFKNKWLSCLEPEDRDKFLNLFKITLSKLIHTKCKAVKQENIKMENTFFNFDSDLKNEQTDGQSGDQLNKAELLMLQFFAEESQELDVLHKYPEIKELFVKYNTHLPSSNQADKLFSFVKMTNLPNNFDEERFEKRVVLKCNLR